MGTTTGIEWTTHTFNPWIGCTKVSEGCRNCYAKTRDDRHMLGQVSHWGPGAPRHVTGAANWRQPLTWAKAARKAGKRAKVFCASQADIFESEAPIEARRRLWDLIGDTYDALDWQILTKRPENIIPALDDDRMNLGFFEACKCWIGTSVENQAAADKRIPELLAVDAAVRFLSCEPLLGSVNLQYPSSFYGEKGPARCCSGIDCGCRGLPIDPPLIYGINWVIAGGESGPGARPMHPDWARSLRDQCAGARVPFFFKQWGEYVGADWENGPRGTTSAATGEKEYWPVNETSLIHRWPDGDYSFHIGKKSAGGLLDGIEHKAFPVVRP